MDSRYPPDDGEPLGAKGLHETFCELVDQDLPDNAYDSWYCIDYLGATVDDVEWHHFYDFVELVGRELIRLEKAGDLDEASPAGFAAYRRELNELFEEHNVAWHMDPRGELGQRLPGMLSRAVEATDESLKDRYDPAREHFLKARRYLYQSPRDPANATKEIVSALESVARTRYPEARTLGVAIGRMRKDSLTSPQLLSVLEKFYAFSNAEPSVRHGSPHPSRIGTVEAEFALLLGVAAIRLLIDLFDDDV